MNLDQWLVPSVIISAVSLSLLFVVQIVKWSKQWAVTLFTAINKSNLSEIVATNNKNASEMVAEIKSIRLEVQSSNNQNKKIMAKFILLWRDSRNHGYRIDEAETKLLHIGKITDLQHTLQWHFLTILRTLAVQTATKGELDDMLASCAGLMETIEKISDKALIITNVHGGEPEG